MKKMFIILLFIFLLLGGLNYIINLSPQLKVREEIDTITVRNGATGDIVQLTETQEIIRIVDTINEFGLRKKKLISSQTGWSIILDLKEKNRQQTTSLVLREDGIEYKNNLKICLINPFHEMIERPAGRDRRFRKRVGDYRNIYEIVDQ